MGISQNRSNKTASAAMTDKQQIQIIRNLINNVLPVRDLASICIDYFFPNLSFYVSSQGGKRCESLSDTIRFGLQFSFRFQTYPLQIDRQCPSDLSKLLEHCDHIDNTVEFRIDDDRLLREIGRYKLINGLFYTENSDGITQAYTGFDSFAVYKQWKRAWLNTISPIGSHDCGKMGHIVGQYDPGKYLGRNYRLCVICYRAFTTPPTFPCEKTANVYCGTEFVWHRGVLQRVIDWSNVTHKEGKFNPSEFWVVLPAALA